MKATIYIPEDKADLYEKARAELGGTISAAFVRCMERELEAKRAATNRIIVEIYDKDSGRYSKKAFEGRWLVGDPRLLEEHVFPEQMGSALFAVAATRQNRIVVVSGEAQEDLVSFEVYSDVEDFASANDAGWPRYPESLVAAVKGELGLDHIEELDI
jgi:hypothetical protein